MKNLLKVWNPLEITPESMIVESIQDDYEGFRIILTDYNKRGQYLKIGFDQYFFYRNTDESYMINYGNAIDKEILKKTFFIVENSEYYDFFIKSIPEVYEDMDVTHYPIYSLADCIDILAEKPPVVSWLN